MASDRIDGRTAVYGLMGDPVEHTLSPAIHNTMAELTGQNLVYLPFHVFRDCDMERTLQGAHALGIRGMNVTVPHKKAVIPFLTEISEEAAAVGAVNTLVWTGEGYRGCNTDVYGLSRNLADAGISLQGKRVILIGAGGAARAAAWLCGRDGAEKLYIANRTMENARKLEEESRKNHPELETKCLSLSEAPGLGEKDLIAIQCTSVGLYPDNNKAPVTDPAFYRQLSFAMDTIYRPGRTRFMQLAEENGAGARNGLGMLLWQGLRSFEIWTGQSVTDQQAAKVRALLESLTACP